MSEERKELHCPYCDKETSSTVLGEKDVCEGGYGKRTYALRCRGCEGLFLWSAEYELGECLHSDDITIYPTPKSKLAHEMRTELKIYNPSHNYPSDSMSSTKQFADCLYKEICCAINTNNRILAASGIRTLIDAICRIVTEKTNAKDGFSRNLKDLCENGHITDKDKNSLESLQNIGSGAAHRDSAPPQEILKSCMLIIENLIERLFILPAHVNATTTFSKDKVPSRHGKENAKKP